MKMYEAKFNELYKGKQYVEIEIIDEEPMTTMFCRYNQSRLVCSSIEESSIAKLKEKNGVKQIECDTYNCQYRQKNEQGKMACNRKGWLKFIMPNISRNGVFIMQISSQESIENLKNYFTFQKCQGLSIKGQYVLFLTQKEQTNSLGQSFHNFILNIIPKEDFIQDNQNQQKTENTDSLSTKNAQNVNNDAGKVEIPQDNTTNIETTNQNANTNVTETKTTDTVDTKKAKKTTRTSTTKSKKTTKKDAEEPKKPEVTDTENSNQIALLPGNTENISNTDDGKCEDDNVQNYYVLIKTFNGKIKDKYGVEKDYLIGEFHDKDENPCQIVIKPEDKIISSYGTGTLAIIDVKEVLERKFAMNIEYVNIFPKEKVA